MVDQNLTHVVRRNGHEVRPALEVRRRLLTNQPQVSLVDKRGRLERVSRPFPAQVGGREPMELAVENLRNLAQGRGIATPPVL